MDKQPFVINTNRDYVKNFESNKYTENLVWISISEPETEFTSNELLDNIPNVKLKFWDVTHRIQDIKNSDISYDPPKESDAEIIVDFILLHQNKNVLVNCAAGVSRSGAVAKFCEDCLNYRWHESGKKNARPNTLLYTMMKKYYEKRVLVQK